MTAPSLRIPIRADLQPFKDSMNQTSSLARDAASFVAKQFAKQQIKLAVNSDGVRAGVQAATNIVQEEFQKLKPGIQNLTQTIAKESVETSIKTASLLAMPALKGSFEAVTAVGVPAMKGLVEASLPLLGRFALIAGAVALVGDTISVARRQLEQMVEVADKSANSGFSADTWQSWVAGAKGAEKQVSSFEGALTNAYQALKPVLNPDWSVWDDGVKKVSAVEQSMREMRELFTTDQDYSGFQQFKSAQTQDQQLEAVLVYMKQLQSIGQNIAALDLAEKLFGASFADKIRTNQLSIDELLENIRTKSPDAFSAEIVQRAKDLDDRLNDAWHTIDQNLHPSMDAVDSIALNLKELWVEIVQLMAKAAGLLNPTLTGSDTLAVRLAATGEPGFQTTEAVEQAGAAAPAPTRVIIDGGSTAVPLPRRRPADAPKPPTQTDAGVDRFETSAESIERRVAALKAEALTLDLGAGARDKSRIAAQLETVAMQANAVAGLGANVVTEEQRKRINEVAEAYGKATDAIERAKVASSISFGRQTAFLTSEDVSIAQQLRGIYGDDVPKAMASTEASALRMNDAMREVSQTMSSSMTSGLADMLDGTKSVSQGFSDMAKSIVRSIEEAVIKMQIVAPIMRSLQGLIGGGSEGGLFDFLIGGSNPIAGMTGKAEGGYTGPGGKYEPADIVHKGEIVWSQADIARSGGVAAVESMRLGRRGYADGGYVGGPWQSAPQQSAPQINVNLIEDSNRAGQVEQKDNGQGGFDIDAYVDSIVAKKAANPGSATSQVLAQRGRLASR